MEEEKKSHHWHTKEHLDHNYGDLAWHLFWGIVVGVTVTVAIITKNFWLLITGLMALILFFHPKFYETRGLDITINESGIEINGVSHPWKEFIGFEIFHSQKRSYIFLIPNRIFSIGLTIPVDSDKIDLEEIRKMLNKYLDEYENAVGFLEKIYRGLFP
ncbi:MAG: hypothetical protein QXO57_04015 [Candidatus Aenigmatarchaeota archaeon]